MKFGMENGPDISQGKPFLDRRFAHADPGDIPLPDVHDALSVVDQVMDLPLQDGFEIILQLAAGHLDVNSQGQAIALFDIGHIRTHYLDLAVLDGVHIDHP